MTTLTYNPNEAPEGELTAEEQDSLAVGEKAFAEQQELLAGKFRDAEELEQAYIELQKKFSSRTPEEDTATEEGSTEEDGVEQEEEVIIEDVNEEVKEGEGEKDLQHFCGLQKIFLKGP